MVVKVRKTVSISGREFEAIVYLPEDVLLTRERRQSADELDKQLKSEVEKINKAYDLLSERNKKVEIKKWRWLGLKISALLKNVDKVERKDIDNNVIWPAIGQYLRSELKRGFDDRKRSGTKNDHYRKCWALATIPGSDWISSWAGWDAFTDRGKQLVYSENGKKLMQIIKEKLGGEKLKSRQEMVFAKFIVEHLPSLSKHPADIQSMDEKDLRQIVNSAYNRLNT